MAEDVFLGAEPQQGVGDPGMNPIFFVPFRAPPCVHSPAHDQ